MDAFVNRWEDRLPSMLLQPMADWLSTHPLLAWLVAHPLWALALVALLLLLLAGLWSAIARLTETFWLTLVKAPFRLATWIFAGIIGGLRRPAALRSEASPDRLQAIVLRLESLQQEQDALIQEMRQLLAEQAQD